MTYADKGMNLFSMMNDMSDALILESDIRSAAVVKPKRERIGRFSSFMNHPAMVAVLCAVVSLGVVVAIVMAGRGGPVKPPVVGTPSANTEVPSDPNESGADTIPSEIIDPDEWITVAMLLDIRVRLERFLVWSETDGVSIDGTGFQGECNSGELVQNGDSFTVYMKPNCEFQSVTVYDSFDMSTVATSAEPVISHDLKGLFYVVLRVKVQQDTGASCYDYVFPLTLCKTVEGLRFDIVYQEETQPPLEPETRYEPTETVYACTLVAEHTAYYLDADYIKTTIVAAEPGKIWEGNGCSYRLCRLEGDDEIEIYRYAVAPWCESYPKSSDDYATVSLWCNLTEVRRVLSEKGETLTAGKYRMYYLADTYLGIECPYVDVELMDRGTMEQTNQYTLIPHTPTAGINEKYFKISMTATEPGKALTAGGNYRLYRLHGDEEELIHDYDVELAVYEEPAGPNAYAVYETGVSLVWAKSNLEAKGDTLTPGWYRVKFGRATLDFELVDKTGNTPEVHPFAELSVPVSVYTSLNTEDMALYEQYERIYQSAYKIERLWAVLQSMTVTEATPPENIRSGDGLGIHVTYPDGTKGRIFFWGEEFTYFYVDDSPWYQVSPAEAERLMTQIRNVMSDPT